MTIPALSSTTPAQSVGFDDTNLDVDTRQLIADVQARLNVVHPRPTPTQTTGAIDADTARHLQAFQDAQGLNPTGALDQATIDALNAAEAASIDDTPATLRPGERALLTAVQRALSSAPAAPDDALMSGLRSRDLLAAGASMTRSDVERLILDAGASPSQASALMERLERAMSEHFEAQMREAVIGEFDTMLEDLDRLTEAPHRLVGQMISEPEQWLSQLDAVDGPVADDLRARLRTVASGHNTRANMQALQALVPAVVQQLREGVAEVRTSVFNNDLGSMDVTNAFPRAAGLVGIDGASPRDVVAIAGGRDHHSLLGTFIAHSRSHHDHTWANAATVTISTVGTAFGPVGAVAAGLVNAGRGAARALDAQQQLENARLGSAMGLSDAATVRALEEQRDGAVRDVFVGAATEAVVGGGLAASGAFHVAGGALQRGLAGAVEGGLTGAAAVAVETAARGAH